MNALIVKLYLSQPVLATQPQSGEENSSTAYNFVPGSMIRGALTAAYQRAHPRAYLATDDMARRLFFDGTVRFLNAYPLHVSSGKRMLPRPFSWFVEKEEADEPTATIYDFAVVIDPALKNPKPPGREFCYFHVDAVEFYAPARQVNVHNASQNRNVKQATTSTVYRYDAIAAGETLVAVIVADEAKDLEDLKKLFPDEMALGGSYTAGYGRVQVSDIETRSDWREHEEVLARTDQENPPSSKIFITLLSDTLVRGENGRVNGDLDFAIQQALHLSKKPQHIAAYRELRVVGGFNRTAGLPLAQEWALQAGSVFVYDANAYAVDQLRALTARGLGERRAEGFGRFAVNWHRQAQLPQRKLDPSQNRPILVHLPQNELSADSRRLAQDMARRQLRAFLDRELVALVNRALLSKNLPNNAQLSRVRTAARQALATHSLGSVTDLMKNLKGARQQFEDARVSNEVMFDWINKHADLSDKVFRQEFRVTSDSLPSIAGETAGVTPELRVEYCARLIDGVMRKAIEQRKKEGK